MTSFVNFRVSFFVTFCNNDGREKKLVLKFSLSPSILTKGFNIKGLETFQVDFQ